MKYNEYTVTMVIEVADQEGSDDLSGLPTVDEMRSDQAEFLSGVLATRIKAYAGTVLGTDISVSLFEKQTLDIVPPPPPEVVKAFEHVRAVYPSMGINRMIVKPSGVVIFGCELSDGVVHTVPNPDHRISSAILDAASNAAQRPSIYYVKE